MNRQRDRLVRMLGPGLIFLGLLAPASGQSPADSNRRAGPAPVGSSLREEVAPDRPDPRSTRQSQPAAEFTAGRGVPAESRPIEGQTATSGEAAVICEPSQGRPIFITPGETFVFVMRLATGLDGDVSFSLRHALEPAVKVALKPTTPPSYSDEYCTLVLLVPPGTREGLYDLEVRGAGSVHEARRCVSVLGAFKTRFRIVHLSNMNIGDLTAPGFDDMLPNEINVLAPEFIIATGDYTEWSRARDDASSWSRVLAFFEKFQAPVFMLCGAHDHEASFTRFVANKPIGTIDYGEYHGLLLLDHPGNPIEQDYNQIRWIETDLKRNRHKRLNFIASNADELGLLDVWKEQGDLPGFVRDHKLKMYLVGGSADWDYKEFAGKLSGLDGLNYIRTHQSSTSLRDRATGFSHYRVIDVDGDSLACVYPDDNAVEKAQHSIPTGRLRVFFDGPNDGGRSKVGATVMNALNQGFKECRLWLRVAKSASNSEPVVAPGRVLTVLDAGSHWACEVGFDLPDKGAVRIEAATDPRQLPPALPIEVSLVGPQEWAFGQKTTDFGLAYFESASPVSLKLANRASVPVTCWPVIRVNGGELHPDPKVHPRLPLTIEPGKPVNVPLVLHLRRVSPGRHALQVHFLEDPLSRLHTFDVELSYGSEVAKVADPTDR